MRPTGLNRGAGANEYYSGCATEVGTLRLKAWFAAHAHAALKGRFPRLQIKVSVLILIVIFVVAFLLVIGIVAEVFHPFLVLRFRAGAETGFPILLDCGRKLRNALPVSQLRGKGGLPMRKLFLILVSLGLLALTACDSNVSDKAAEKVLRAATVRRMRALVVCR